ncbi:MAG TPA: hypothetical protein VF343_08075 [Syntrophales bacterium]
MTTHVKEFLVTNLRLSRICDCLTSTNEDCCNKNVSRSFLIILNLKWRAAEIEGSRQKRVDGKRREEGTIHPLAI